MLKRWAISHRPSPALAVAILALVVASGGTAIAAGSLVNGDTLIKKNSLSGNRLRSHSVTGKQIKLSQLGRVPSAIHADSATNATNARNATNATDATNATNATNATTASNLATLPSGHSESGFYATASGGGNTGYIAEGITFPQPLAAAIPQGNVQWLAQGTTSTSCPGVGRAAPNHVCLYDNEEYAVTLCCIYDFALDNPAADKNGFIAFWYPGNARAYVAGEWTVTAP